MLAEEFKKIDLNGNGTLSREELHTFFESRVRFEKNVESISLLMKKFIFQTDYIHDDCFRELKILTRGKQ